MLVELRLMFRVEQNETCLPSKQHDPKSAQSEWSASHQVMSKFFTCHFKQEVWIEHSEQLRQMF